MKSKIIFHILRMLLQYHQPPFVSVTEYIKNTKIDFVLIKSFFFIKKMRVKYIKFLFIISLTIFIHLTIEREHDGIKINANPLKSIHESKTKFMTIKVIIVVCFNDGTATRDAPLRFHC